METQSPALTPSGAAAELGISIDTLKRWEADGRISSYRTEGGHRRFPREEVQRLLDKRAAQVSGAGEAS